MIALCNLHIQKKFAKSQLWHNILYNWEFACGEILSRFGIWIKIKPCAYQSNCYACAANVVKLMPVRRREGKTLLSYFSTLKLMLFQFYDLESFLGKSPQLAHFNWPKIEVRIPSHRQRLLSNQQDRQQNFVLYSSLNPSAFFTFSSSSCVWRKKRTFHPEKNFHP